jgi:CubicO group peptidase (beta-lactamase class C family)
MRRALPVLLAACATQPHAPPPLADAFDAAARVANLTSLSVWRDGQVVREAYFAGTDATTAHDVRSVTKTVTSLIVGIAIDTGCLSSLDQPIGPLLGDRAPSDPAKAAIRIRDLLSMSSGFAWEENGAIGFNAWALAPDQVAYALAPPLVATPGTTFNYNSGAIHLLSAIVTRACAPTAAFAAQHLFAPLGIASRAWEADNQGIASGAAGLQLTIPEMVAIGQLILDRGKRGATQVVPAAYLDQATRTQVGTGDVADETPGYGFGLWIGQPPSGAPFVLAEGYGGQFIVVVPDARAVIVAATNWQGLGGQANDDYNQLYNIIVTQLLPGL